MGLASSAAEPAVAQLGTVAIHFRGGCVNDGDVGFRREEEATMTPSVAVRVLDGERRSTGTS